MNNKTVMHNKTVACVAIIMVCWALAAMAPWIMGAQESQFSALKNQPLSAFNWISLADEYHTNGDVENRNKALSAAQSLSNNRPQFALQVWQRHVLWQDPQSARLSARRLITLDAQQTYSVFEVMRRFFSVAEFVSAIIPEHFEQQIQSRETFIDKLFEGAIKAKDYLTLQKIWAALDATSRQSFVNSQAFFNYYSALSRAKAFNTIHAMATGHDTTQVFTGTPLLLKLNQGSEASPLCWQQQLHPAATVKKHKASLIVDMPATRDRIAHQLLCYLPISVPQLTRIDVLSHWQNQSTARAPTGLSIRQLVKPSNTRRLIPFRDTRNGNWNDKISHTVSVDQHTLGLELIIQLPRPESGRSQFSVDAFTITPSQAVSNAISATSPPR